MASTTSCGNRAHTGHLVPAAILRKEILMRSIRLRIRSRIVTFSLAVIAGALALSVASGAARAQDAAATVHWVAVGPQGSQIGSGKVNAFAFDVKNPKIMYFGGGWGNTPRESPSQSGVFGTTDGGQHWTALDRGLT